MNNYGINSNDHFNYINSLNYHENQNVQNSPELLIDENELEPKGSIELHKSPDPGRAEAMGKKNILQWVRDNMGKDTGNIESVTPRKMTDDHGNAEWQLLDVKDSKGNTKTHLEIQVFWVIKTSDGKERIATQFLQTGVVWPTKSSSNQLEALRRATLSIDLYTHTMALPLVKSSSDLPTGFKFNDLVHFDRLYISLGSSGPLRGRMKVEIATPLGQSGESKGLHYSLVQKVNTLGKVILGNKINYHKIDHTARHSVVKESGGREVNPHAHKTYQTDEMFDELLAGNLNIEDKKELQENFKDPTQRNALLKFMDKERNSHVIDFTIADNAILAGPKTVWGARFAKVKNLLPFNVGPTDQQPLQKYMDYRQEVGKIDTQVEKLEEKMNQLAEKKEALNNNLKTANTEEKPKLEIQIKSVENQHKSASKELEQLRSEQEQYHEDLDVEKDKLEDYFSDMQGAYEFLLEKNRRYHAAAFNVARIAYEAAGHRYLKPKTLKDMIDAKGVRKKLSPVEHHFIVKTQTMEQELKVMEEKIDEARKGLYPPTDDDIDVELEEEDY